MATKVIMYLGLHDRLFDTEEEADASFIVSEFSAWLWDVGSDGCELDMGQLAEALLKTFPNLLQDFKTMKELKNGRTAQSNSSC